jgi:hypothetical protein
MIPLSQRRPASITLFAAAFLIAALVAFADAMGDLPAFQIHMGRYVPQIVWTRDAAIVTLSARLSIALIPVAMVWLSAVRFARWMVTVLGLGKLVNLPDAIRLVAGGGAIDAAWLASLALGLLAVALLFTPASNRWFAAKGGAEKGVSV